MGRGSRHPVTSWVKFVALFAGVSMVIAGLAMLVTGVVFLVEGNEPARLTVVSGPEITIPAQSTVLGGSVMLYTAEPVEDPLFTQGCELVRADGEVTSGTRIDSIAAALTGPVTVDRTTWHPLAEIEVLPEAATLRCPGDALTSAALSGETTFGRSTTAIGVFALAFGLVALVLGSGAILVGRYLPR